MVTTCIDCGRLIPTAAPESFCPVCLFSHAIDGGSQNEDLESLCPDPANRYRHLAEYARGGMGRVVLAYDSVFKRRVALKELLHKGTGEPALAREARGNGAARRFNQEAHILAHLEHPGIVPVYELGNRPDGTPFYAMRFVEGRTLHDAIHQAHDIQARLALLPVFVAVCQTIAFAHSRGVLHRDIKPANVLLGEFGEAIVIDWGLAKVTGPSRFYKEDLFDWTQEELSTEAVHTRQGEALGTPAYMSPEQARADHRAIDERSDVYALGAVLYEILTGRPPFVADTVIDIIGKVLAGPPVAPCRVDPHLPRALSAICMRALAPRPEDRYQTVEDLVAELARFESGALVDAHEYTPGELFRRFVRRYRLPIALAATALLALLSIGGFAYINIATARDAERNQRLVAERDNYYLNMRVAQSDLTDRRYDAAKDILWNSPEARRNWEWGFLLRSAYLEQWKSAPSGVILDLALSSDGTLLAAATREGPCPVWRISPLEEMPALSGHADTVTDIEFSPDGKKILTASKDNTACLWDPITGTKLVELKGHPFALRAAAFCALGSHVVTVSDDHTARIWDVESGKELRILAGHETGIGRVAVSPNGHYILTGDLNGGVRLWDEATGEMLAELPGHEGTIVEMHFSHDGTKAVTTSEVGGLFLWEIPSGRLLHELRGHKGAALTADFSPDDTRLITGSDDMTARVWNVADGSLERTMRELRNDANIARFTPDGRRMFAATYNGLIRVWDSSDGAWQTTIGGGLDHVKSLAVAPDSRTVYAAMQKEVLAFDLGYGDVRAALHGHANSVNGFAFNSDGTELATFCGYFRDTSFSREATKPGRVPGVRWNTRNFRQLEALSPRLSGLITGVYHGDSLLVITRDGHLWDAIATAPVCTLGGASQDLLEAVFSPEGRSVLTMPRGKPGASLWDAQTGKVLATVMPDANPVLCASFSPDGHIFATSAGSSPIYVFDTATGTLLERLDSQNDWTIALAFSHDGKYLAAGTANGLDTVIWSWADGKRHSTLRGHRAPVMDVAFSPDDTRIATAGSWDTTVRIWDPETGAELVKLAGPEEILASCAWSPDGRQVFAGYTSGEALVWEAAPWREKDLPGDSTLDWKNRFYNVYRGDVMMNFAQYP